MISAANITPIETIKSLRTRRNAASMVTFASYSKSPSSANGCWWLPPPCESILIFTRLKKRPITAIISISFPRTSFDGFLILSTASMTNQRVMEIRNNTLKRVEIISERYQPKVNSLVACLRESLRAKMDRPKPIRSPAKCVTSVNIAIEFAR